MRLIDADAFTEFLKETIKQQKYEDTKIDGLLTVADVIEAVISELDGTSLDGFKNAPTVNAEPMWVPCSERLPEYDGGMYLVTDYCEQINRRRIHISYCYVNREGFWSDIPIGYKVIAWMPLPKPYREDGE